MMQRAITFWKSFDPARSTQDHVVACLHAMFDEVLGERLPERLSTLLEELDREEGEEDKGRMAQAKKAVATAPTESNLWRPGCDDRGYARRR
jgi:Anti-sigma factor NepR